MATKVKPWTRTVSERAARMYRQGFRVTDIAKSCGRTPAAVKSKLRDLGVTRTFGDGLGRASRRGKVDETHGDARDITWTTDKPVRTEAEAVAKAGVNLKEWNVDRCRIGGWGPAGNQCWQVRLELSRKRGWNNREFARELIAELRRARPACAVKRPWRTAKGVLAELSISDHHFGKLSWKPETGEDYDLKIARERYRKAAVRLIGEAVAEGATEALVVAGNDFYHVDRGSENTTTAGTRQDADGRWQKAFVVGATELRNAIDLAADEIGRVRVKIVPGNHDSEKAFTLAVVLGAVYERDKRVCVDVSPALASCYQWGTVLLGFQHGHNMRAERFKQLPNEMAHLWPREWAATSWREWHLGHLHSESEDVWRYRASETLGDVIVRRLPSLCGTDSWHRANGYRSLGAAELHLYDATFGRVGYKTISQLALEKL
jgi:hypothetical protein